ncbi:MAG: hypothetical protein GXC73_17250 [Chitinophagaceae bacterium]|nr:hypothetical protein [Chitinophagaceae bacterium]
MKDKTTFQALYYLNNVTFSILLVITMSTGVMIIFEILQSIGIITKTSPEIQISFDSIRKWLSSLALTYCFYQTFLALYSIKQDNFSEYYWKRKFIKSGVVLIFLAALNMITVADKGDNESFLIRYATLYRDYGITSTPIFYVVASVWTFFISSLKPQTT